MALNTTVLEKVFSYDGMNAFVNKKYVDMVLKEAGMVVNLDKSKKYSHEVWVDQFGHEVTVSVVAGELVIKH